MESSRTIFTSGNLLSMFKCPTKGEWISKVYDLHKKYGNVVLLSPNEISVNGDPKYLTDIYVKNSQSQSFMKTLEIMDSG